MKLKLETRKRNKESALKTRSDYYILVTLFFFYQILQKREGKMNKTNKALNCGEDSAEGKKDKRLEIN